MTGLGRFQADWGGKRVLIMGLGLLGGGVQVAKFFCDLNCHVTVTDLRPKKVLQPSLSALRNRNVHFVLGKHRREDFLESDLVIRNPAVPEDSPYLTLARKAGIPVKMEAALFAAYAPGKLIGITGTRGKSTTAALIYHMLENAGKDTLLAGNQPDRASLPLLGEVKPNTWSVLELSSWQLQGFGEERISPHIAVVTNIYPDHLNRYSSMHAYIQDKKIITKFQKQGDYLILNRRFRELQSFANLSPAKIIWAKGGNISSPKLPGVHNRENIAQAIAVTKILGIKQATITKAIRAFTPLPFRLETIGTINGRTIINDTTSTSPIATERALETVKKPVVLIVGGESKRLPLTRLAVRINQTAAGVVLLRGKGTRELKPKLKKTLIAGEYADVKQALKRALAIAPPRATILFSPAFTSFGLFANEFDRGVAFNRAVKNLA